MPAAEVAARVRESLANLKANDLKDAQVMEVLTLAQQLTDTMQLFFGSLDQSIHKEFVYYRRLYRPHAQRDIPAATERYQGATHPDRRRGTGSRCHRHRAGHRSHHGGGRGPAG